jgi:phage/plasmid-associated DNA primase
VAEHPISDALRGELRLSGLTDEQIDRLHYSSATAEQAKALTGHAHAGWVVPCLAASGKPYATSKGKPFYRLKPTVPPIKDGKETRYLSPAGEGCRPYFSVLWPDWARTLKHRDRDLAEGEKKADCGCAHGFPTIGLSGVDGWRDQRSGKSAVLPELLTTGWLKGTVRIAWDSDIVHKTSVMASSCDLASAIAAAGGTPLITLLPPELNGEKNGVDDFILRHGAAAYGLLRDYARPAGEIIRDEGEPTGLKWTWTTEPKGDEATHSKAVIAWSVLKDEVQLLPLGAYRWTGTHWQRQEKDKPAEYVARLLHTWMDQIRWKKRTGAAFSSVLSELKSRLESPEGVIWDAPHLMAFSNGTLNTRTNTFTPGHRRSDRLTRCLPYPYDLEATCPNWLAFLEEASGADQHLITTVQAGMRWTIEPKQDRDYETDYLMDLIGNKGRGKGVVLSGVVALCGGSKNIATIKSSSFGDPNARLKMLNKAASIDFDASGFIKDSGVLNSIVSNEPVEVKALYQNLAQARLNTVIWRAMNDRPGQASAGAEGSDRRSIVIPFDITPARKDPELKAKIRAEAAGIFQWVWRMTMEKASYALRHAGDSGRIRNAQVEAALDRNPVLSFLYETFFAQGCDEIDATALFDSFREWMEKGKEDGLPRGRELTKTKFGREMGKLVSTGLQRQPLVDAHGAFFEKFRTAGLNPGRNAYRIPEIGGWPIGAFLTGCSPDDSVGPAATAGEGNPSGNAPTPQNPSARDPRPPLNPEQLEPFEKLKEKSSIGTPDKGPSPAPLSMEAGGHENAQTLQALETPSGASDLGTEYSGRVEGLAPEAPQNTPSGLIATAEMDITALQPWQKLAIQESARGGIPATIRLHRDMPTTVTPIQIKTFLAQPDIAALVEQRKQRQQEAAA